MLARSWPSHTMTFQKHCWCDWRSVPAYTTPKVVSPLTFCVSHKSPSLLSKISGVDATRIRYAVCICPRESEVTIQLNSGRRWSTPKGLVRYSQRSRWGRSSPRDVSSGDYGKRQQQLASHYCQYTQTQSQVCHWDSLKRFDLNQLLDDGPASKYTSRTEQHCQHQVDRVRLWDG